MTAEQIRQLNSDWFGQIEDHTARPGLANFFLGEIAAQLAELNVNLDKYCKKTHMDALLGGL